MVAAPGHSLAGASYDDGQAVYACACGVVQPPLPPVTAAAHRYQHLEIFVSKNTDPIKFTGEPLANAGRSIYEIIWEELDTVYARLMAGEGTVTDQDPGMARGLAYALAVLTNPYDPSVDVIRHRAHIRWEASLSDEDLARHEAAEADS